MDFLNELAEIDSHFKDVDSAIREYFSQILNGNFHNRPDLSDSSSEDITVLFKKRLLENERSISLTILAALEAWFRKDCEERAEKREKSPMGARFKEMYAASGKTVYKIRFDDILDTWSSVHPETKQIIGQVKAARNYRHWLAHGRYGTPKLGRGYDYFTVYDIAHDAAELLRPNERGIA
ncbi:MAG: hypothetical protein LBV79_09805 [Candidatus Adiutrix sp.]|jgi:hypothetical protein|nr:hypothetical protein [Candidatus Adiutrix sp.]